jgi:hypothetical protein
VDRYIRQYRNGRDASFRGWAILAFHGGAVVVIAMVALKASSFLEHDRRPLKELSAGSFSEAVLVVISR